jgi:hypothetical protein
MAATAPSLWGAPPVPSNNIPSAPAEGAREGCSGGPV